MEEEPKWEVRGEYEEAPHVIAVLPLGEEHDETSIFCRCRPKMQDEQKNGKFVLVHNAFDGRERWEPAIV